jgi:predicted PurR-regulated permease PerM
MPKPARLRRPPPPYPRVVTLVTLCLIGALLYVAQEVLVPLALAVLLTFLLAPLVALLQRVRVGPVGVGRVPAVLVSVLLGVGVIGALLWAVESQFVDVVNKLPQYTQQIREKVVKLTSGGGTFGTIAEKLQTTYKAVSPPTTLPARVGPAATNPAAATNSAAAGTDGGGAESPAAPAPPADGGNVPAAHLPAPLAGATARPGAPTLPFVTPDNPLPVRVYAETPSLAGAVTGYLSKSLNPLATAFLVLVFVIFMLLGQEDLRDRMIRLAGTGQLDLTTEALDDAGHRVSRYLLAQSLVNGIYAVLVGAGLWVIGKTLGSGTPGGFPNVVLFGLLCGVFRFIPYVGPWLGAAMPLAIAFGFFPTNGVFFATLALFVVLEVTVSQVAEPVLYGSSTGLSAIAVLVAAAFWAWLWGPIGLLLSTPITVVLVVMGRYIPQLRFLPVLLGDEPALAAHARAYQRLAALDRDQATDVATAYAKEHGLAAAYDDVLLPALAMAEQNHHRGTLSRERYRFVRRHVRDLADELAELPEAAGGGGGGSGEAVRTSASGTATSPVVPDAAADPAGGRVVCVPASGLADEIAAGMLAAVLRRQGFDATALPARPRDGTDPWAAVAGVDAVCVSALPPAAAAHARRACKRVAALAGGGASPSAAATPGSGPAVVVGLWSPRDRPSAAPAGQSGTTAGEKSTTAKAVQPATDATPARPGGVPDAVRRRVACDDRTAVVDTLAAAVAAVRERLAGGN